MVVAGELCRVLVSADKEHPSEPSIRVLVDDLLEACVESEKDVLTLICPNGQKLMVQVELAKSSSPYFRAMLESGMQESGKCNEKSVLSMQPWVSLSLRCCLGRRTGSCR
jgi:hypothetical protein